MSNSGYYDKKKQVPKKIRDAQDNTTLLYHNENNELIQTISPNGAKTDYEYNNQGEVVSITNPLKGTTTLEYDTHGNLVKKTDAKNNSTTYTYTREQQLKSRSNALNQSSYLEYYNTHNDFKTQTKSIAKGSYDNPITIEYDKNGVETRVSYPNGLEESYGFDSNYNLINIQTANKSLHYEYNANGEIVRKNSTVYVYDAIGRLRKAGSRVFHYDKAGNNLVNQSKYDLKSNRLIENQSYTFTYDARGNLIYKKAKSSALESTEYTFNALNQLVSLEITQNQKRVKGFEYAYDALGRRISKRVYDANNHHQTIKHYYLYDKQNIIAILDENKRAIATIVHHDTKIDTPLSITTLYGTFYYHRDHQGSIIALSDEYGDIVENIEYDEHYGRIINHTKREDIETLNPYGYTGREIETDELYSSYAN